MKNESSIGIIDSGIGGLTVAKEIFNEMPYENIIYFGDTKNFPYGNKTEDEIFSLGLDMIRFMKSRGVKCVAVACNTISSIIERFRPLFPFPIISTVECAVNAVCKNKPSAVGLLATTFTVNAGNYNKLLAQKLPDCKMISVGSPKLAALIDDGHINDEYTDAEIVYCINNILKEQNVKDIILGCTHYPIAYNSFKKNYPDINFINPALSQCNEVKRILTENGSLNNSGGNFELYSSGDVENYLNILKLLGARMPDNSETIIL